MSALQVTELRALHFYTFTLLLLSVWEELILRTNCSTIITAYKKMLVGYCIILLMYSVYSHLEVSLLLFKLFSIIIICLCYIMAII